MKKIICNLFLLVGLVAGSWSAHAQSVGINTDGSAPNNSAILDVSSDSKGVLIPRMTQAQRDAIVSPATGLMIYQVNNTPGFYFFNGSAWAAVGGSSTAAYPNIELHVENNVVQTIACANGIANETNDFCINDNASVLLNFSGGNNANASLTGGNTWTDNNTFTVGATGAGWYRVTVQIVGTTADGSSPDARGVMFYMDKNNVAGTDVTKTIKYRGVLTSSTTSSFLRNVSTMNVELYLAPNDILKFYGQSGTNAGAPARTSSNGSTFLTIERIK